LHHCWIPKMVLSDPDGVPYNVVDRYLTIVLANRLYFFKE
jgi:hypothetical protein